MQEALGRNLVSGSTATVVLLANDQILATNLGDSKSLLCSDNLHISDRKGRHCMLKALGIPSLFLVNNFSA